MNEISIFGGKGGSSSFKQTPDNLRSNDTFEGVMGVGIGPLKGPKRGLKSIKLNGTALENETGESNFGGWITTLADGDPAAFPQNVQLKLGAGGAPTAVGQQLTNSFLSRTLTVTGADYIDLRFIANQLFKQDSKGVYTTTASIEIRMKPVGSTTWINPQLGNPTTTYNESGYNFAGLAGAILRMYLPRIMFDSSGNYRAQPSYYVINGKTTTSPAVYELRIGVPNTGAYANKSWDIQARIVEATSSDDGNGNIQQRNISWESISAVFSTVLGSHEDWRGVSWMQMYGLASDQLNGVPDVEGEWYGKIVSTPPTSIYNAETRAYVAGTWDGSWAKQWTNDPAWIINDVISDSLSGIAALAPGASLNKWDALECSKWWSQLVPNGAGGTHPRASLNLSINDVQKAEDFIRYLAGAVGALAWDTGSGEWRMKADKLEAPVDLFTLDNIEGEFVWAHTDVDTRYNDITMKFLNEEKDYAEDSVRVYDNDSIAKIGRKPITLVAVGCTNRQEALRRAEMRKLSAVGEFRMVNFTTNRRGRNIDQFDTILVADGDLGTSAQRTTGRTIAVSADRKTITLRDSVYIAPGVAYQLRFTSPNPNYTPAPSGQPPADWTKPTLTGTRTVMNTTGQRGNVAVIYLDTALPADIPDNLSIALEAPSLPSIPRLVRVLNVVKSDGDGERISINALEIKTDKWTLSDNVTNAATVFQDLRGQAPMPTGPTAGAVATLGGYPTENGVQYNLVLNWTRPTSSFLSGFRGRYRMNGGAWKVLFDNYNQTTYEIVNPEVGTYEFEIMSVTRRGDTSPPLVATIAVTADRLKGIADALNTKINALASDGIIAAGSEKQDAEIERQRLNDALTALQLRFTALGSPADLQTAYDNMTNAVANLNTYVGNQPDYFDRTKDTPVSATLWATRWTDANKRIEEFTAAIAGRPGADGLNSATVYLYQRATSAPAVPSATVTYTFASGAVSGQNNGWSATIPAGTNPIYVTAAAAVANGTTDTIATGEWAAPVVLAQNGGSGTAGLNTKTIFLYQRATSVPAVPSATVTHTFATNATTGLTNGWDVTIPTGVNPLYVTTATALSNTASDTIAPGEWATPSIMAQDGAAGAPGLNNATVLLYQRASSAPAVPSATVTYTFATASASGLTNGWQTTIPAGSNSLYVTAAVASAAGATDTIATGEWSAPTIMAQNGAGGAAGLNTRALFLYQRATSAPAVPSATVTHTFASNSTTGVNNGWSLTIPAGSGPVYVTTAVAISNTASDTIAPGEWSTPTILAQDGSAGMPFPMVARGGGYIDGNKIGKGAAGTPNAYSDDVYSTQSFRGGAYLSFRSQQLVQSLLVGLSPTPAADQSYGYMAASWHLSGNGNCYAYTTDQQRKDCGSYDTNTAFAITYDGQRFRWYKDGAEVFFDAAAPDQVLFFDSTFYQPNVGVKDVAFGPMPAASGSTLNLTPLTAQTRVQGGSVATISDGGWGNAGAVSRESYNGGCSTTFSYSAVHGDNWMAGLSQTGFSDNASFSPITFALHRNDAGNMFAFINGTQYGGVLTNQTAAGVGKVEFDGRAVRWYVNGISYWTYDWMGTTGDPNAPENKLFFRCALASDAPRLDDIVFVPRGTAGKNGVDGTPGVKGADGTTWYPYFAYANSPDGNTDFTTGEPGSRAYVGTATGTSPTEPGLPGLYSWSQYKGPPFGMATRGNAVVAGDQIIKATGVENWDSDAYSTVSYRSGAVASFQFSANTYAMAGLNTDPTYDASYTSLDFAWYGAPGGELQIYEDGNFRGQIGGYDANTKLQVQYDGRYIRYFKDGVLARGPIDVGADKLFYFDSSLARVGARITNISFAANGTLGAAGASAVGVSLGANSVTVAANADGSTKSGSLPKTVSLKVMNGNSDVTASAGVGMTSTDGDNIQASYANGLISVNVANVEGSITVNVSYAGQTFTNKIQIVRQRDAPPPQSTTSGSASLIATPQTTAYADSGASGRVVVLQANNSGQLNMYANGTYSPQTGGANTSFIARGKMQYRVQGSNAAWNDAGAEVAGTSAIYVSGESTPGEISISQTVGGLTPTAFYEVRAIFRKSGGTMTSATVLGTLGATQP